jgi:hypothetical protein
VSVRHRMRRLEASVRGTSACAGCGLRPRDSGGYIVVEDRDPAPHVPEVCLECGRSTKSHIRVVYEGDEGEGATVGG